MVKRQKRKNRKSKNKNQLKDLEELLQDFYDQNEKFKWTMELAFKEDLISMF